MAIPISVFPIPQRTLTDCALCCLASLLGLDYKTVQAAAEKSVKGWDKGLTASELQRVARRLKHPLKIERIPGELEDKTGILYVRIGRHFHAVLLFNGSVYDPSDGTWWEVEGYLGVKHAKPHALFHP